MFPKRASAAEQPKQVCHECGVKYGREFRDGCYTYWADKCGVCSENKPVTDPRNFSYLIKDWTSHVRT